MIQAGNKPRTKTTATMSEATKMHNAPINVRRWPNCVISLELSSMPTVMPASTPVHSHCARSWPMPKAPVMSRMATLT